MLGKLEEQQPQLRKIYLSMSYGKLVRTENGEKEFFSFVEGKIENLTQRDRHFNGETIVYWYIDLRDEESGELYSVGFPYYSNVFKSVILNLASAEDLAKGSVVKLEPYEKDGQQKVKVFCNGKKLSWVVSELPPIKIVEVAGRKIKDDSERMNLIQKYAIEIGQKIGVIRK